MIRLLIVGGPATVQKGLLMGLDAEPDFNIIGETSNCDQALQWVNELQPDVLVIDLEMPKGGGLALAEMVGSISPHTAVIALSIHDDLITCTQARNAGVAALVGKTMPTKTLFSTIRAVAA
jgi:DNA-binding NarL/FixJ family response regulator